MKNLNIAGLSSLAVATILWVTPVFNNKDLMPESRICFRPKQVLNEENKHLLNCDSNNRVGIILTSIFNDLDKRDIEFSSKVASDSITKHFDSNLEQTKNFQLFSIGFGLMSLGCFVKSESERKANRNKAYHDRRKEYVSNEYEVDGELYPQSPTQKAMNRQLGLKQYKLSLTEADKQISENELETAKNYKEIGKVNGKKQNANGILNYI